MIPRSWHARSHRGGKRHLWSQLLDGEAPPTYAGGVSMGEAVVLRADGTITLAHFGEQHAEQATLFDTNGYRYSCFVTDTIAVDLIAWLRLYALTGGLAKAEPKTLRHRLFHTPARLVHARRYRWLGVRRPSKISPAKNQGPRQPQPCSTRDLSGSSRTPSLAAGVPGRDRAGLAATKVAHGIPQRGEMADIRCAVVPSFRVICPATGTEPSRGRGDTCVTGPPCDPHTIALALVSRNCGGFHQATGCFPRVRLPAVVFEHKGARITRRWPTFADESNAEFEAKGRWFRCRATSFSNAGRH